MQRIIVLLMILPALAWNTSLAAELRLRQQCSPHGSVVTLGDIAEIYSADARQAEKLAAVELFPAPPAAQQRVLRVREVQDILALQGINLAQHRFSGASQIVLASAAEPAHADQSLTSSAVKRAQRRVQEAILQYLQAKTGSNEPRLLQFDTPPALARAAANPVQPISLSGGAAPWTGSQHFELRIDSSEGLAPFTLEVQVIVPSAVVAAVHSLSRGAVIRESDLALVRDAPREGESGVYHSIEEVAGKQAARAVPDGKIIAPDDLQAPLLVHKGDVVTVYARSAGIRVRTIARARDDGSLGDLVTMETMQDRKPYQARVCGAREAEVLAQVVPAAERK
ncbi:MAG: flagellar basal body P-ring formation chaperone FlgA [Thermoguttaceae bacterium]